MKKFQNILVGVDLSQASQPSSTQFSPPVQEAIHESLWLAEKTKAVLTFFTAIETPEDTPYLDLIFDEPQDLLRSFTATAHDQLAQLVGDAQAKGITAKAEVAQGVAWMEIIRHVEREPQDLVIAGTRNVGSVERFLFGSTAQKLLRNCPCPVWVTHPDGIPHVTRILVACDLQPVSAKALAAAATLAPLAGAEIHLVHAVAYPLERVGLANIDDEHRDRYRKQVQADARRALDEQVAVLGAAGAEVKIAVVDGNRGADVAILRYIDEHQIDMLAMGTVARGGLTGFLVGNTAERMLHEAHCSLLAVKPDEFQAPELPAPPSPPKPTPYM